MLLIVTDIFGAQPEVLNQFDQLGLDYLCVQPYDHQPPIFADDSEAYQYFLDHGGIEAYSTKLAALLKLQSQPVFLVGFSAGAAACWANLVLQNVPIVSWLLWWPNTADASPSAALSNRVNIYRGSAFFGGGTNGCFSW